MSERTWVRAVEWQYATLRNLHEVARRFARERKQDKAEHFGRTVSLVEAAVPFLWHAEPAALIAAEARTIPDSTVVDADLLPEGAQACWFCFDPPLRYTIDYTGEIDNLQGTPIDRTVVPALVCGWLGRQLVVDVFRHLGRGADGTDWSQTLVPALTCVLNQGRTIAESMRDTGDAAVAQLVVAACRFLQTRRASVEDGPVERHHRKQLARGIPGAPLIANVRRVTLRRPEIHHEEPSGEAYLDPRTYRYLVPQQKVHRWCGHGDEKELKLVDRKPHINGPKGKPLKIAPLIYEVKR